MGIILMTVMSVVQFVRPAMLFALGTVLITKAYLFRHFGDVGVDRLPLALSFSPFWFNHAGSLGLHFHIVLDLLKNQEKGPSIDWSCVLSQVILGLPLGQTHAQRLCCKVGRIQG